MRLEGEFTVIINKYGKKTHSNIRAISHKITANEIIITTICNQVLRYDRNEYESHVIIYDKAF